VHVDHLNWPVMLTDAAKVNVWSAIYEPFGRVHSVTGTVTQNLGLPGQWFQLEHGLAYNWHRHYDPTTGRYTTADPLGFVDGPSVFAYVGSAPHTKVDPTGQFLPVLFAGVAGAYVFTPSVANAPGSGCVTYPSNDWEPFKNALVAASVLSPHWWLSKREWGGGVRLYRDGPGVDFHSFKYKGVNAKRLHLHRGKDNELKKHRPYQGGW
jgi:RHS repeat-associated protein